MPRPWTSEEIGLVAGRYPQEGSGLTRMLDRSAGAVRSFARVLGLKSVYRKRQALSRALGSRSVNAHFFDKPNPSNAFVLGVALTRGHVRDNPRHVLRFRMPLEREHVLLLVRQEMQSKHRIQRAGGFVQLEICNSILVKSIVQTYDPSGSGLPELPDILLPALARGMLEAAGYQDRERITWSGPERVIEYLSLQIQEQACVPVPTSGDQGNRRTIGWSGQATVQALRQWLSFRGKEG